MATIRFIKEHKTMIIICVITYIVVYHFVIERHWNKSLRGSIIAAAGTDGNAVLQPQSNSVGKGFFSSLWHLRLPDNLWISATDEDSPKTSTMYNVHIEDSQLVHTFEVVRNGDHHQVTPSDERSRISRSIGNCNRWWNYVT